MMGKLDGADTVDSVVVPQLVMRESVASPHTPA